MGDDNLIVGYLDNVNKDVEVHIADCNNIDTMVQYTRGCDIVFSCGLHSV